MPRHPTKKQRELLDFIDNFITKHGFSPSYREIMSLLSYASVSTVATHVDNLVTLGYLRKTDHSARSLEVVRQKNKTYNNPFVIKPVQEKWLVDIINAKFKALEGDNPSQKEVDDVFVLVGALHVLGLGEVAAAFKTKLKNYR